MLVDVLLDLLYCHVSSSRLIFFVFAVHHSSHSILVIELCFLPENCAGLMAFIIFLIWLDLWFLNFRWWRVNNLTGNSDWDTLYSSLGSLFR